MLPVALLGVGAHVPAEHGGLAGGVGAVRVRAREGLVASVDPDVVLEVAALHRAVRALGARERLLAGVHAAVPLQVLAGGGRVRAHGAAEGLFTRVRPQVDVEVVAARRGVRAVGAGVRLLRIESLRRRRPTISFLADTTRAFGLIY